MHIILFGEHGNQLIAQHKGYDHSGNRYNHRIRQILDQAENTAVPALGRLPNNSRNFAHLAVDAIKQTVQIAQNTADQQALEPFRNFIPDEIQKSHPLSQELWFERPALARYFSRKVPSRLRGRAQSASSADQGFQQGNQRKSYQ